jgi:hypothetical protein
MPPPRIRTPSQQPSRCLILHTTQCIRKPGCYPRPPQDWTCTYWVHPIPWDRPATRVPLCPRKAGSSNSSRLAGGANPLGNDANDKKRPHWSHLERWMRARGKEKTKDTINERRPINRVSSSELLVQERRLRSPLVMVPVGYDRCIRSIFEISTESKQMLIGKNGTIV